MDIVRHIKKALEAIDGVAEAQAFMRKVRQFLTLTADVADDVLTKAVEEQDYKVLSVE